MTIPDDWKNISKDYIERRVTGKPLDVSRLWSTCLAELSQAELHTVDPGTGSPAKQGKRYGSFVNTVTEEAVPVRLGQSREVVYLKPKGGRANLGYRKIEVLNLPLATDRAIIAAMTSLEAHEVDLNALDSREIRVLLGEDPPVFGHLPLAQSEEEKQQHFADNRGATYVIGLLRHFRPDFEDLPVEERLELVKGGCERVNVFLKALDRMVNYFEYGAPGTNLQKEIKIAERHIRAAELADVMRMNSIEIGKELGIKPPPSDRFNGTNTTVRDSIKRGRSLLIEAFTKEGWQELADSMRSEQERYQSMDWHEQIVDFIAEKLNVSITEAREMAARLNGTC